MSLFSRQIIRSLTTFNKLGSSMRNISGYIPNDRSPEPENDFFMMDMDMDLFPYSVFSPRKWNRLIYLS